MKPRRKQFTYLVKKWWQQLTMEDLRCGWRWVLEFGTGALLFVALLWALPMLAQLFR